MRGVTVVALVLAGSLLCAAYAQEEGTPTVESMPPAVVKTVPEAGDTAVDPGLKEIRVTFSKEMKTEKMWAWCQVSKETYPEIVGAIRYLEDKRTCVAPVRLEPGKTYIIWFNLGKYNSFRDTDDHPAVPYLLVFQTKK